MKYKYRALVGFHRFIYANANPKLETDEIKQDIFR